MEDKHMNITYEQFKTGNDEAKKYFTVLGSIVDTNMREGTCTFEYDGNVSYNVPIENIVSNILFDGMGAIKNPSKLKEWKGFTPRFTLRG